MNEPLIPKEWIERLFLRFQAVYGSRATAMWNEVPKADLMDAWRDGLAGHRGEDIAGAVDLLPSRFPEWPPTLGEFLGLCRDVAQTRAQSVTKVPGPKISMPDHVRAQLKAFTAKVRI